MIQVKVLNWVDGVEVDYFTGLTAQFGASLPSDADQTVRFPAAFVDPLDSCSNLSSRVCVSFIGLHSAIHSLQVNGLHRFM